MLVRLVVVCILKGHNFSNFCFVPIHKKLFKLFLRGNELRLRVANNHDFSHIVVSGEIHWGFLAGVLDANTCAVLNQKLAHLSLAGLCSEVQRCSLVHINSVDVGSELKQLLNDFVLVCLLIENRVVEGGAACVVFHMHQICVLTHED